MIRTALTCSLLAGLLLAGGLIHLLMAKKHKKTAEVK